MENKIMKMEEKLKEILDNYEEKIERYEQKVYVAWLVLRLRQDMTYIPCYRLLILLIN